MVSFQTFYIYTFHCACPLLPLTPLHLFLWIFFACVHLCFHFLLIICVLSRFCLCLRSVCVVFGYFLFPWITCCVYLFLCFRVYLWCFCFCLCSYNVFLCVFFDSYLFVSFIHSLFLFVCLTQLLPAIRAHTLVRPCQSGQIVRTNNPFFIRQVSNKDGCARPELALAAAIVKTTQIDRAIPKFVLVLVGCARITIQCFVPVGIPWLLNWESPPKYYCFCDYIEKCNSLYESHVNRAVNARWMVGFWRLFKNLWWRRSDQSLQQS